MSPLPIEADPTAPPWESLRDTLLQLAETLARDGQDTAASGLRTTVESWWTHQSAWNAAVARRLRVHHEINNALVGVSGHTQLLLMGGSSEPAALRDRLEVVLREARRIENAALGLRELKQIFETRTGGTHGGA